MGARFVGENQSAAGAGARRERRVAIRRAATAAAGTPRPLPVEIRGVHVTGALASLPGKFREYVGYKRYGLNTIELDVKDEGGEIGFSPAERAARAHASAPRAGSTTRRRSSRSPTGTGST